MLRKLLILAAAACVVACDSHDEHALPKSAEAPALASMAETITVTGQRQRRDGARADVRGQTATQNASLLLAYRYDYALRLPPAALADVYETHLETCRTAGPETCRILSAQIANPDGDQPSARLELRAAPDWISQLRDRLHDDAQTAGGSIVNAQTFVEDLTARIIDTEARVRARITLRDRLQGLLENQDGALEDLLAVERELADVQEELDAARSLLEVLRRRVEMSTLTLSYQPARSVMTPSAFSPISEAISDMGRVFSEALGTLILFLAAALPWVVIGAPLVWLLARWLRRRTSGRSASQDR